MSDNKRQAFSKNTGASSFYQRNTNEDVVNKLFNEIGRQIEHEVDVCEYMIRGKDHLGQKTINQYSIVKELGAGAFGTVYLVHTNETHEDFAMKVYSKQVMGSKKETIRDETTGKLKVKDYLEDTRKEIEIMKRLNSMNVVRL